MTLCASRSSGRRSFTGSSPQCPAEKPGDSSCGDRVLGGSIAHQSSIGPVRGRQKSIEKLGLLLLLTLRSMPCTRARSSHTRQRTSSYDEPSAARRPRRGRAHSSAPRGRRAPSLQSTLFIAAPQGHSGRNHSVWGTRAATRHRKRHPPSCVVDPPRASFRPAPLPTDLRPRILYRPPPRAGSYNLRSGSCTYLTPVCFRVCVRVFVSWFVRVCPVVGDGTLFHIEYRSN